MTLLTHWRALLLASLSLALSVAACSESASTEMRPPADLVVDAAAAGKQIQRNLAGIHARPMAQVVDSAEGLEVGFFRGVVSAGDGFHYDCETETVDEASLTQFNGWLDAVQAIGAEPMLALSYVPECISNGGHPKSYPLDADAYERFVEVFTRTFVSDRIDAGKEPLRYLEAWNEPDIPFDNDNLSHGHGWVGSQDDYMERVFVPLGRAVMAEELRSGVDIEFGGMASFHGTRFGDFFPDLETFAAVGGVPEDEIEEVVSVLEFFLEPVGGAALIVEAGGFDWADRLAVEAEAADIDYEFISWHTYVNNPFQGTGEFGGGTATDLILLSRYVNLQQPNPLANIAQYRDEARGFRERHPGKEMLLTEWSISPGADERFVTYDQAAFYVATLIALQEGGLDAAMHLGTPPGPARYAHEFFDKMEDQEVSVELAEPSESSGVWVMASGDPNRLTLLAAQWHSLESESESRTLTVELSGLLPGRYHASLYRIDKNRPGSDEPDEVFIVDEGNLARIDLELDGQSVAFVELVPE